MATEIASVIKDDSPLLTDIRTMMTTKSIPFPLYIYYLQNYEGRKHGSTLSLLFPIYITQ